MLELLIYIVISTLFTLMISTWIITVYTPMQKASHACTIAPMLCALRDVFIRDVREAPMQNMLWKKNTETELIWHKVDDVLDIGWAITPEHTVVRTQGYYNQQTNQWEQKTRSLLAHHVKVLRMTVHQQSNIIMSVTMQIILTHDTNPYQYEGTLRQRIL